MENKKTSIVPIDSNAYANVGAKVNTDSNINSNIVDQINNSNSIPEIQNQTNSSYSVIDVNSLDSSNQYYDVEQSNSRKSINDHSSIVNQYNNVNNNVVDEYKASSYEDQLNNSKDLVFYTQQPKPQPELPQQPMMQPQMMPQQPMMQPQYNPYAGYNMQGMMPQQPMMQPQMMPQQPVMQPQYNPYPDYSNQQNYNTVPSYYSPMGFPAMQTVAPGPQIQSVPGSANDNSIHTKHRETIGEEAFKKKMKKNVRPFNFLLVIIYLLIIGLIGYFGYNLWLDRQVFSVSKQRMNLALGSSYQEKIYVKGELDTSDNYTWKSKDETIAKVDSKGNISSVKTGTTTITVTNKKTKKQIDITVKVIAVQIYQFDIKESEKVLYIGNDPFTIEPLINEQNSLTIDLEWANSNTAVASVSDEGVVTAKKPGRTTITVSVPNTKFKDSITIIVVEKKK